MLSSNAACCLLSPKLLPRGSLKCVTGPLQSCSGTTPSQQAASGQRKQLPTLAGSCSISLALPIQPGAGRPRHRDSPSPGHLPGDGHRLRPGQAARPHQGTQLRVAGAGARLGPAKSHSRKCFHWGRGWPCPWLPHSTWSLSRLHQLCSPGPGGQTIGARVLSDPSTPATG